LFGAPDLQMNPSGTTGAQTARGRRLPEKRRYSVRHYRPLSANIWQGSRGPLTALNMVRAELEKEHVDFDAHA